MQRLQRAWPEWARGSQPAGHWKAAVWLRVGDSIFWCIMHHRGLTLSFSLGPTAGPWLYRNRLIFVSTGVWRALDVTIKWLINRMAKCDFKTRRTWRWLPGDSGRLARAPSLADKHTSGLCFQRVSPPLLKNFSFVPASVQSVFITFPPASPVVKLPPPEVWHQIAFSCRKHLQDGDALFMPPIVWNNGNWMD